MHSFKKHNVVFLQSYFSVDSIQGQALDKINNGGKRGTQVG